MSYEVTQGSQSESIPDGGQGRKKLKASMVVALLGICMLVAGLAVFFASSAPDGLEAVAEDQGFAESAQDSATAELPFADYGEPASVNGLMVGALGLAATGVVAFGGFWLLSRRRDSSSEA